ncbi:DUF2917 domain-containing protein [Piscinibacter sp. XHJ-5]|uniref:DUF2917 domain-containing protein n=1 Tax=Piscinibacter sp. XHJ-5 TaxID=3037797 RepID=UPI002453092C|nr:DUF2917 domain-containing protein [Piscinibacter sp. XHJ-5]
MSDRDHPIVPIHLRDGELLRCADRRDAWVTVVRGRVWITQAGDPDDHFLDAGQAMHLAAGSQSLVGAEGAARIMVMQGPDRPAPPRHRTITQEFRATPTHELAES